MVKVLIETETDEIVEQVTADSRGRITLGSSFAGETLSVAVVEREEDASE